MTLENRYEHIEDIIAKFLAGEATLEEKQLLEEWKSLNSSNSREFDQMSMLFTESASLRKDVNVNADLAWSKVKSGIHQSKPVVIPMQSGLNRTVWLRIAAVFVLIAVFGAVLYFSLQPLSSSNVEFATGDSTQKTMLPDGSEITLNKNSSIQYASASYSNKRIIKLQGEAFFDVKHDEKIPFVVEVGTLQVQDIGTSFNVKAYRNSGIVIVSVVSGEVKILAADDKSILLAAGEEASYNLETQNLSKAEEIDKNISAYKDKIFIFENTELIRVIKTLNDIYGSSLLLSNEKLGECRITATFNNENIDDIASVIAETLGLTIQKANGSITFQGDACK